MTLVAALGAKPTPVAIAELYLALSTGVVDAQDNPFATTIARKFYEVTDAMALTGHIIAAQLMVINEKSWQKLSDKQSGARFWKPMRRGAHRVEVNRVRRRAGRQGLSGRPGHEVHRTRQVRLDQTCPELSISIVPRSAAIGKWISTSGFRL